MKDTELLQQVLEIGSPWQITRVVNNPAGRQIEVWVAEQAGRTGWFFGQKQAVAEGPERVWRHVNLGGWRCFIHVAASSGQALAGLPWCGDNDVPFTRTMARQIATLLWEGVKFQAICTLLDVRVDDLWKFKHGLDSGKTGLASAQAAPAAPSQEDSPASGVPDPGDPVWERLLDGSINIDIHVLSLKLLLTKLREQMQVITDAEVRMLKAHEMHRYFARYEQLLGHELAQLRQS